jgi:hypothetical protein
VAGSRGARRSRGNSNSVSFCASTYGPGDDADVFGPQRSAVEAAALIPITIDTGSFDFLDGSFVPV